MRLRQPRRPEEERGDPTDHAVSVHLDQLLIRRGMTLTELADRVGVTIVNLSILKNGRAKAVRFSTLTRICQVLDCQPGDILTVELRRDLAPESA